VYATGQANGGAVVQIIGHRGCADHYPENTLAAIRGCRPHVDMVEIDVRRCASGEVVVFHDETLDRLTAGTGPVSEHALDELPPVTVGKTTEPIPTLAETLDALPDGIGVNVELKQAGMDKNVAPMLRSLDRDVIVSSFETAALVAFRDEPVPTAYLFRDSFDDALDTAVELGCEYVHPHYGTADTAAIDRAHDRDMGVNAWTVPSAAEVQRLQEAGVDGVIVDSWTVVPEADGTE
jgi:glycerophosphoryl diester phosphodiesterase